MKSSKWFAPVLPYLAVWAGLFWLKSAWLALAGFHLAILLVLGIARPRIPSDILFRTNHSKWIFTSIILCASSGVALYFLHPCLGLAEDLSSELAGIGLTRSTWIPFITYFSLINPFIEEYFWRGYLGSETRGIHAGDLIYAGYHGLVLMGKMQPLMIGLALVCLTFIGWLWRQVARADDGLLIPLLGHAAGDFSILMSIYLITI